MFLWFHCLALAHPWVPFALIPSKGLSNTMPAYRPPPAFDIPRFPRPLYNTPKLPKLQTCVCTTPRDTRRRHLLIILRVWGRRGRKCWDVCFSQRLRFWIGFLKHYSDLRKSGVRMESKCVLSCSRAVVPPLDSLHWSHLMCPPSLQSLEGPIRLLEPRHQSPTRRLLCE